MKEMIRRTVTRRGPLNARPVRPSAPFRIKTIVVPVDSTAGSRRAVIAAKALARQAGAELVLLSVVGELRHLKDFGYGPVDWPHHDEWELKRSRRRLEGLRCQAGRECVLCTAEVRSGDPATEISRASLALGADLIVMATHHLAAPPAESTRSRSVAEDVLRTTRLPVLLLPFRASGRER